MKNKSVTNLLLISISLSFVFCFVFIFLYRGINKNIKTTDKLKTELSEEMSRREEIKDFNESFKLIEQERNLFETHFVQHSNIVPFLNKIEDVAKSVNTQIEISLVEISKDNIGLVIQMENTGTFSNIYKFINLLENFPYELELSSINIYSDYTENKKSTDNLWKANITIKLTSFI